MAIKFFEHFAYIAAAMNELWDEHDGFYYDRMRRRDGSIVVVRTRSMVGLVPVFASVELSATLWDLCPSFAGGRAGSSKTCRTNRASSTVSPAADRWS